MATPINEKLAKNVAAGALEASKAKNAALKQQLISAQEEVEALEAKVEELEATIVELRNPAPVIAKPIVPDGPTKFRVTKGGLINLNGSMTVIATGQTVTLGVYGAHGLQQMRASKLGLEPLED